MKTTHDNGLMKMAELVAATGVSKQTIHFYLREGLLSPPVQTSRNMAYYDDRHIAEIRMIKELKEKRYYPLAVIKMIMESRRSGRDLDQADHLEALDKLFINEGGADAGVGVSRDRFNEETGLKDSVIDRLLQAGLLVSAPIFDKNSEIFNSYDVALGRSLKRILDLGFALDDLLLFKDYLGLMRRETHLAHDRIIDGQQQPHPPMTEIIEALNQVRRLLGQKAYREFIIEHRHDGPAGERGKNDD